jgi:NitT/TauT family transport system permease protein
MKSTIVIRPKRSVLLDLGLILFVFALLYAVIRLGLGMVQPYTASVQISLNPWMLPYYAGRSLLRMFIALVWSVLFTFVYARIAARYRAAEKIMIPLLDILQSVPVLSFLTVTVVFFTGLFPHSILGAELASIFAIFTGQVWNMTFSFYQSLIAIPKDLREASALYGIRGLRAFTLLELPFAMVPFVWNSMMSFGGGWFFLAVSESISVMGKTVQLPGLGSYMAVAMNKGDTLHLFYAVLAMIIVIVGVDQLFWRPIVVWSQKFKVEQSVAVDIPTSWFLTLIRRSQGLEWVDQRVFEPARIRLREWLGRPRAARPSRVLPQRVRRTVAALFFAVLLVVLLYYGYKGLTSLSGLGWHGIVVPVGLGVLTMLRVACSVILGMLWAVPVGVYIGMHPKISRIAQPVVLIAASFPAYMFFPIITLIFLQYHISIEWGSIVLMMLGTQWYILFNVIAGAMSIPNDLREASDMLQLRGVSRWKKLIVPAILPTLITGLVTASGGAWNASIVAEIVSWKGQTLVARGLGSYITQAAASSNGWTQVIWGTIVMSVFVVAINRLVWHRLYRLAESKYRLE